ncbi:MAG: DUF4363 family protein [Clostridiales bacterium]|nr:DUF4363 family protein [Clostridiales bacterium]
MRKEIVAIALLAALFAGSLLNIKIIRRITSSLYDNVLSAMNCADQEDWNSAGEYTERAVWQWDKSKRYLMVFIRHTEIDTVSSSLNDFRTEIINRDPDRTIGMGEKALEQIKSIEETESVSFGSLF